MIMKALVIHAAKLKKRGEHMDRMLRGIGMEYEFIREADLDDLSKELLCKYFTQGEKMAASPLPRYSCATKHFLAYKKIVDGECDLIFVAKPSNAERPAMISYEDSSLQFVPRSQRKKGQLLYYGKKDRMAGAYYMSRRCAEAILSDLSAHKCHTTDADTYHYHLLKQGVIDYLWCQPALATQGSFTGAFRSSLSSKKDRMIEFRWWFKKNYKRLLYWFR